VDIFTCNMDVDMQPGLDVMKRYFVPGRMDVQEVTRGILPAQHALSTAAGP
jgi:S-adenosylmethionine/arginine decarboxylase-like enzyme